MTPVRDTINLAVQVGPIAVSAPSDHRMRLPIRFRLYSAFVLWSFVAIAALEAAAL